MDPVTRRVHSGGKLKVHPCSVQHVHMLSPVPDKWHSQTSNESCTGTAHGGYQMRAKNVRKPRLVPSFTNYLGVALALNADEAGDTSTVSLSTFHLWFPQILPGSCAVAGALILGFRTLAPRFPMSMTSMLSGSRSCPTAPLTIRLAAKTHSRLQNFRGRWLCASEPSHDITSGLPTIRVRIVASVAHPAEFSNSSETRRVEDEPRSVSWI